MTELSAPPMLLCTRFGLGVKDPAWFNHRLALTSAITVPSILSQRDQGVHWVWMVDEDIPAGVRSQLEEMLSPFGGRAFLDSGPHTRARLLHFAKERGLIDQSGRILTARIDDDDAWSTDTVGLVRRKVMEWEEGEEKTTGIGVTFSQGLEWVMYDMLDIDRLQQKGRRVIHPASIRNYMYPFHSMSVHVYSLWSGGMTAMSAGHSHMGEVLSRRNHAVEVISTDEPMWLYCRHKQVDSSVKKARGGALDLVVADLTERFGIDERKTVAYVEAADRYGYATLKRPPAEFGKLERRLAEIRRRRSRADGEEACSLAAEERRLKEELSRLSENIVGEPDERSVLMGHESTG